MNPWKPIVFTFAVACALLAAPHRVCAEPDRVLTGAISRIAELGFELRGGQPAVFEAVGFSPASRPVLHLLASPERTEVANSGAGTRLSFTPPTDRNFVVVVRSRDGSSAGTADLLQNGRPVARGIPFGGWHLTLRNLAAGESIETVRLPNGAGEGHRMYVLAPDGVGIAKHVLAAFPEAVRGYS